MMTSIKRENRDIKCAYKQLDKRIEQNAHIRVFGTNMSQEQEIITNNSMYHAGLLLSQKTGLVFKRVKEYIEHRLDEEELAILLGRDNIDIKEKIELRLWLGRGGKIKKDISEDF